MLKRLRDSGIQASPAGQRVLTDKFGAAHPNGGDTATDTQLSHFNAAPLNDFAAYALRLLPLGDGTGGLLVANTSFATSYVTKLKGDGTVDANNLNVGAQFGFPVKFD